MSYPELLSKCRSDCFLVFATVLTTGLQKDAADGVASSGNGRRDERMQASMEQQLLGCGGDMISPLAE